MPELALGQFATAELLADPHHIVGVVDPAMVVRWISTSASNYGLDAVGRSIVDLIHPDDFQRAAQAFDGSAQRKGFEPSLMSASPIPLRIITGTGVVPFEATGRWFHDDDKALWLITSLRDVSTRYAIDRAFRQLATGCTEQESVRSVIDAAHEFGGVAGAQMLWTSGRARKTFGDLGAQLALVDDLLGDLSCVEAPGCVLDLDGSDWASAFPVRAGRDRLGTLAIWGRGPRPDVAFTAAAMVSLLDLAALSLKRAGELAELQRQATTDQITGLLNRHAFFALLEGLVHQSAIMYIDLDDFKAINDEFGHTVGDRLLRVVSRRISDALGPDDFVGRVGGDEFAVLCRCASSDQVRATGERIVDALNRTFVIDGHSIAAGASVGIAYCGSATRGRPLLDRADQALLEAKAQGKGRTAIVFTIS